MSLFGFESRILVLIVQFLVITYLLLLMATNGDKECYNHVGSFTVSVAEIVELKLLTA